LGNLPKIKRSKFHKVPQNIRWPRCHLVSHNSSRCSSAGGRQAGRLEHDHLSPRHSQEIGEALSAGYGLSQPLPHTSIVEALAHQLDAQVGTLAGPKGTIVSVTRATFSAKTRAA
jgi:hypothetical protein